MKSRSSLINDPYRSTIMGRLATDQKTVTERKWQQRTIAPVAQKPCDHGLFSDDAQQNDLIDKLNRA